MTIRPAATGCRRRIRPADLAFLFAETHGEPLHVGALLVFDAPPATAGWTLADLVALYRSASPVAPFNRIPEFPPFGSPRWLERDAVDMHYHVRHLRVPAPGGERQLCELVQELHSEPLDRRQSLFRAFVVEGLADGGFALYAKVHHALVDGISGITRVVRSLSSDVRDPIGPPFFASVPAGRVARPKSIASCPARWTETLMEQARASGDVSSGAVRKMIAALAGAPEPNTPFVAPVTPINGPLSNGRAMAIMSLPIGVLRSIAHSQGGTINDVVLAIVDAAMVRYLAVRGAPVSRPLVAMVPVSLRARGDADATTKASAIVSALGDPDSSPRARMRQIVERMEAAKAEVRAMSKTAATNNAIAMYFLAVGLGSLGVRRPGVNLVVSNVPGPDGDLCLGGARLRGLFPVSALGARIGLNVTLVSRGEQMHMGLVSDRSQLADPERIATLCIEALEELNAAQMKRASSTAPKRKLASSRSRCDGSSLKHKESEARQ